MGADIINLRHVKKSRARLEKEQQAAQNRLHFGRSKTEKEMVNRRNAMERDKLDAHQRIRPASEDGEKDA